LHVIEIVISTEMTFVCGVVGNRWMGGSGNGRWSGT
jgi:hypothetical protein